MQTNLWSQFNKYVKSSCNVSALFLCTAALIVGDNNIFLSAAQADPSSHPSFPIYQTLPTKQSIACPDVELLAVAGTFDSLANDDPFHPHTSPDSVLNKIIIPLREKYPHSRLETYTVPYVAQLRSVDTPHDVMYKESHLQGQHRLEQRLRTVNAHCPVTKFIIIGFSQGAQISGDVAAELGTQGKPIDPRLVPFIALISDPRRVHGKSFDIAPSPQGDGVETAIAQVEARNPQTAPGKKITDIVGLDEPTNGARLHDFGSMDSKVAEICAPHDGVCDSPGFDPAAPLKNLRRTLATTFPRHLGYGTNKYWSINGESAAQWLVNKISKIIDGTPKALH